MAALHMRRDRRTVVVQLVEKKADRRLILNLTTSACMRVPSYIDAISRGNHNDSAGQ